MQPIQLTEPELAFLLDLFSSYRNRRLTAISKTGKNTAAQAMEKQSLAVIRSKLWAMHSQALAATPQAIVNDLPNPVVEQIYP